MRHSILSGSVKSFFLDRVKFFLKKIPIAVDMIVLDETEFELKKDFYTDSILLKLEQKMKDA